MSCDKKMSFEECELAILRSAVDKIGKKTGRKKINNPEKYSLTKNLIWSSPQNLNLTMDIYSPKNISERCPVIVMFHG